MTKANNTGGLPWSLDSIRASKLIVQANHTSVMIVPGGNGTLTGRAGKTQSIRVTGEPVIVVAIDAPTSDRVRPEPSLMPLLPGERIELQPVSAAALAPLIHNTKKWAHVRQRISPERLLRADAHTVKGMNANLAAMVVAAYSGEKETTGAITAALSKLPFGSIVSTWLYLAGGCASGSCPHLLYQVGALTAGKFLHIGVIVLSAEWPCDNKVKAFGRQYVALTHDLPSLFTTARYAWNQGPEGVPMTCEGAPVGALFVIQPEYVDNDPARARVLLGLLAMHLGAPQGSTVLEHIVNADDRNAPGIRRHFATVGLRQIEYNPGLMRDYLALSYVRNLVQDADSAAASNALRSVETMVSRNLGSATPSDPLAWVNKVAQQDVSRAAAAELVGEMERLSLAGDPLGQRKLALSAAAGSILTNFGRAAAADLKRQGAEWIIALEHTTNRLLADNRPDDALALYDGFIDWAENAARRIEDPAGEGSAFAIATESPIEAAERRLQELLSAAAPSEFTETLPAETLNPPVNGVHAVVARAKKCVVQLIKLFNDDDAGAPAGRQRNPEYVGQWVAMQKAAKDVVAYGLRQRAADACVIAVRDIADLARRKALPLRQGVSTLESVKLRIEDRLNALEQATVQAAYLCHAQLAADPALRTKLLDSMRSGGRESAQADRRQALGQASAKAGVPIGGLSVDEIADALLDVAAKRIPAAARTLSGVLHASSGCLERVITILSGTRVWANLGTAALTDRRVAAEKSLYVPEAVAKLFSDGQMPFGWQNRGELGENVILALSTVKGLQAEDFADLPGWQQSYDSLPAEQRRDLFTDERLLDAGDGMITEDRLREAIVSRIAIGKLVWDWGVERNRSTGFRSVKFEPLPPREDRRAFLRATESIARTLEGEHDSLLLKLRRGEDARCLLQEWASDLEAFKAQHGADETHHCLRESLTGGRIPEMLEADARRLLGGGDPITTGGGAQMHDAMTFGSDDTTHSRKGHTPRSKSDDVTTANAGNGRRHRNGARD